MGTSLHISAQHTPVSSALLRSLSVKCGIFTLLPHSDQSSFKCINHGSRLMLFNYYLCDFEQSLNSGQCAHLPGETQFLHWPNEMLQKNTLQILLLDQKKPAFLSATVGQTPWVLSGSLGGDLGQCLPGSCMHLPIPVLARCSTRPLQ